MLSLKTILIGLISCFIAAVIITVSVGLLPLYLNVNNVLTTTTSTTTPTTSTSTTTTPTTTTTTTSTSTTTTTTTTTPTTTTTTVATTTINAVISKQSSPGLSILDLQTINDTISVVESGVLASIVVQVDISHTFRGDLNLQLIAPDQTVIRLHINSGGPSDNLVESYPPTSTVDALSLLDGKSITGSWVLNIYDDSNGDTGVLNSWSLTITRVI